MTPAQLKNLGMYSLAALVGALVATGLNLAQVLSGTDDILLRPLAATFAQSFFGTLSTALAASQLTRLGSEAVARQVNTLRSQGVSRQDMVVVTQEEAVKGIAEAPPPDEGRMPEPERPVCPRPRPRPVLEDEAT